MPAEVVGTAFVRIRALTDELGDEIKKSVDKGIKDAKVDELGKKAGEEISEGIGDALEDKNKGLPDAMDRGAKASRGRGRDYGNIWAREFNDSLNRTLPDRMRQTFRRVRRRIDIGAAFRRDRRQRLVGAFLPSVRAVRERASAILNVVDTLSITMAKTLARGVFSLGRVLVLPALIAALAPIIVNLGVALGAILGSTINAAAGAALALGGGLGAGLLALAPLIAAFTTETDQLKLFKEETAEIFEGFSSVAEVVQEQVFPALLLLFEVIEDMKPVIEDFAKRVGTAFGDFIEGFAEFLSSARGLTLVKGILDGSATAFEAFLRAIAPLTEALLVLFEASLPLAERLAEDIQRLSENFLKFLTETKGETGLEDSLNRLYDTFQLVGGTLADFTIGLFSLFNIGDEAAGTPLFERLRELAAYFREWAREDTQGAIRRIFEDSVPVTKEIFGLISDIFSMLFLGTTSEGHTQGLVGGLQFLRNEALPALPGLFSSIQDAFEEVQPALKDLADAFVEFFIAFKDSDALIHSLQVATEALKAFTAVLAIPGVGDVIGKIVGLALAFGILNLSVIGPIRKLKGGLVDAFKLVTKTADNKTRPSILRLNTAFKRLGTTIKTRLLVPLAGLAKFLGVALVNALKAAAVALAGLSAPALIMIAAILAIGAALWYVVGDFETFKERFSSGIERISGWFSALWQNIQNWWDNTTEAINAAWQFVWEGFRDRLRDIGQWFTDRWEDIKTTFGDLKDNFDAGLKLIGGWFSDLWADIKEFGEEALLAVGGFFTDLKDTAESIVNAIVDFFIKLPGRIGDAVASIPGILADAITPDENSVVGKVINFVVGANGGIFTKATPAIIGEAGDEVLIPLTRPARAMELALQSGLFDVLGTVAPAAPRVVGGATTINRNRSRGGVTFEPGSIVVNAQGAPAGEVASMVTRQLDWALTTRGDR